MDKHRGSKSDGDNKISPLERQAQQTLASNTFPAPPLACDMHVRITSYLIHSIILTFHSSIIMTRLSNFLHPLVCCLNVVRSICLLFLNFSNEWSPQNSFYAEATMYIKQKKRQTNKHAAEICNTSVSPEAQRNRLSSSWIMVITNIDRTDTIITLLESMISILLLIAPHSSARHKS